MTEAQEPISAGMERGNAVPATLPAPMPLSAMATAKNRPADAHRGDKVLFQLADGWAIGFDSRQWMVMRAKKAHGEFHHWQPVSFIASAKAVLERVIHEKNIPVTPEGRARLNALPETFREFFAKHHAYDVMGVA